MAISTFDLSEMLSIEGLQRHCQSIAMLDAILQPEWESRYFSFNSKWFTNEKMASMRDGTSDTLHILFSPQGAIMKGFVQETPMGQYVLEHHQPWPNLYSDVPSEFSDFLREPAFCISDASFCIWRLNSMDRWQTSRISFPEGEDPDGSYDLLSMYDGKPETYQRWAEAYFERKVPIESVNAIFDHQPLTTELIEKLNADVSLDSIQEDRVEIGYPMA